MFGQVSYTLFIDSSGQRTRRLTVCPFTDCISVRTLLATTSYTDTTCPPSTYIHTHTHTYLRGGYLAPAPDSPPSLSSCVLCVCVCVCVLVCFHAHTRYVFEPPTSSYPPTSYPPTSYHLAPTSYSYLLPPTSYPPTSYLLPSAYLPSAYYYPTTLLLCPPFVSSPLISCHPHPPPTHQQNVEFPNSYQGWGGVDLSSTLITPSSPKGLALKVYGDWTTDCKYCHSCTRGRCVNTM